MKWIIDYFFSDSKQRAIVKVSLKEMKLTIECPVDKLENYKKWALGETDQDTLVEKEAFSNKIAVLRRSDLLEFEYLEVNNFIILVEKIKYYLNQPTLLTFYNYIILGVIMFLISIGLMLEKNLNISSLVILNSEASRILYSTYLSALNLAFGISLVSIVLAIPLAYFKSYEPGNGLSKLFSETNRKFGNTIGFTIATLMIILILIDIS